MITQPPIRQIDNWKDAEHNAAAWMRSWGFPDAGAAPGGPDAGLDVRATGAVAQVKFQGAQVGRPELQRLVGARSNQQDRMFFFTASNYSKNAVDYANERDVALFQYDPWGRMTPINVAAISMLRGSAERMSLSTVSTLHPIPIVKLPMLSERTKNHLKQTGTAWASLICFVLPLASLADGEMYTGPLMLDIVVFNGTFVSLWGLGAFFLVQRQRLRSRQP